MLRVCSVVTIACLLTLLPLRAHAQEGSGTGEGEAGELDAQARARFQEGARLMDLGQYARAAEEFRAAYELSQPGAALQSVLGA